MNRAPRRTVTCSSIALVVGLAGCATDPGDNTPTGEGGGKADGSGSSMGSAWSREIVADNASIWNGGPAEWGAGTTIGIRADGTPTIAYYDASNRCNNGGFGTYSPDSLMLATKDAAGWHRRIQVCGPENGYWPRMRVDSQDRTHILFGGGWYTKGQRSHYIRLDPAGQWEASKPIDSGYMYSQSLALTLDDTETPILLSNGKLVAMDGTKLPVFTSSGSQEFMERDSTGALHIVGNTFIPDPNNAGSSTMRMRYAHSDASGITIETPRMQDLSIPLGLAIDSADVPHLLSWTSTPTGGELWHTTRTASGWVDEKIADNVSTKEAALVIGADDELFVVAAGRLLRHPATATSWTTELVSALASARYPSAIFAPDGTLHVAFEQIGPTMSNRSARAYVYHAALAPQ